MNEFRSFQFTQNVSLSFASGPFRQLVWEETVRYLQDSVHIFKIEIGKYGDYTLTTPEGRRISGVCSYLLKEVEAPPSLEPSERVKRVLEAFPAPVPGIRSGNSWYRPERLNSLRIVWDSGACSQLFDCSETPVAYLCLTEGDGRRYDKLYYRCSFFGVPPANKLTKV